MAIGVSVGAAVGVGVAVDVGEGVDMGTDENVGVGIGVGESVGTGVGVGGGVVVGEGVGEGIGDTMVTLVMLLPPVPIIINPSGPTVTRRGPGPMLLLRKLPFTIYAKMTVSGWVWFCAELVVLL